MRMTLQHARLVDASKLIYKVQAPRKPPFFVGCGCRTRRISRMVDHTSQSALDSSPFRTYFGLLIVLTLLDESLAAVRARWIAEYCRKVLHVFFWLPFIFRWPTNNWNNQWIWCVELVLQNSRALRRRIIVIYVPATWTTTARICVVIRRALRRWPALYDRTHIYFIYPAFQ